MITTIQIRDFSVSSAALCLAFWVQRIVWELCHPTDFTVGQGVWWGVAFGIFFGLAIISIVEDCNERADHRAKINREAQ